MLELGLRAGNLPDYRQLNLIASTAEQMANVNIIAHIYGLSDNDRTGTNNSIYYTQLRDRLVIYTIFVSESSLSTYLHPTLNSVYDIDNNDLTSNFVFISDTVEEFTKTVDEVDYKVTFLKTSYSVSSSAIDKRVKITFETITGAKDFGDTYFNSLVVMQVDSNLTTISSLSDEQVSDYSWINKVKEAFRLNMSYSLTCVSEAIAYASYCRDTLRFMNYYNDLYELGAFTNFNPQIVSSLSDIYDTGEFYNVVPYYLTGTITSGTVFDYKTMTQTSANFNKGIEDEGRFINNALYLTTTDTFNKAINSTQYDALNSYDLIMINRDYANRLQGQLYYSILGGAIRTSENPNVPVNVNVIFKSNIDEIPLDYEVTLINNFKLKFGIN